MSRVHAVHTGAALIATATLTLFAAAGAHGFDTGELVAAAVSLGGSHPPGQPLHAIIAHAATLIPLGPIPFRVSVLSGFFAVTAAGGAGWIALRLLDEISDARPDPALRALLPLAAGFTVLIAPPVLRQATRPEIYTLALALFALSVGAALRFGAVEKAGLRFALVAAFAAGLAASLHPPHGLSALVAAFAITFACRREVLVNGRFLGGLALFFALGLLPLLYLPIRAQAGAPMWGAPNSLAGFWDYISARAYRQNLGSGGGSLLDQVSTTLAYLPYAAGVVPFVGLLVLSRHSRKAEAKRRKLIGGVLAATLLAIAGAFVTPIDVEVPDMVAYTAPATLMLVAVGAAGVATIRKRTAAIVAVVATTASLFALRDAPEALDADAPVLDALAASLTSTPPPRSLVVLTGDFAASTWLMEREVRGARPDVAVFVSGLSTSSWHWSSLAAHPAFDGSPVAGRGDDARRRYTSGAMQVAAGRVPILVEDDTWSYGLGAVAGPYLQGTRDPTMTILPDSSGENLAGAIASIARRSSSGDHGVVHAIYRGYQTRRAQRLAKRELPRRALTAARRGIIDGSAHERGLLRGARERIPANTDRASLPRLAPVVGNRDTFGTDRATAIRQAAVVLARFGDGTSAVDLLEAQQGEDPRALLQLAWLAFAAGNTQAAASALDELHRLAPHLDADAAPLAARLEP